MTAPFADLILNPIDPWDARGLGLPALAAVALALVVLTVWAYAGAREAGWRRLLAVLALRLGALLVACLVLLRPSFADRSEAVVPSKLLVVVDDSLSMNINDAFNNLSRWDAARQILRAPPVAALLKRLQNEQKVEIVYYRASEEVRKFEPDGKAAGKRTDVGHWLRSLVKIHGSEPNLRGLVLLTDGIDNGTRFPALEEAARWRGVPCPIYTFALGSETATLKQNDIALTAIHADPAPVPVKNKLTVKALIDAPGFEGQSVDVQLLVDGKPAAPVKRVVLRKRKGNEVVVGELRPEKAGEIKVTVEVGAVPGEVNAENNKMSTYVTVTSEGVSVLWVEGKKRAYESVFAIRHALALDRRFSVFFTERLRDGRATGKEDWFDLKNKHYDVIVIGDIPADRFAGGRAGVFKEINELVKDKGTGLLLLGGAETLGKGGWPNVAEIAELLPVDLTRDGAGEQLDEKTLVKVMPTPRGLDYVLRLSEGDGRHAWDNLPPLEGMTRVGKPRDNADVFATGEIPGEPGVAVMVASKFGEGRTLVFGGDTTWRVWRRDKGAIKAYERFWKQVVLWLAKREDADGNVRVVPDTRRVAAGSHNRVGFTVEARGKGGLPVPDATFKVKVFGPDKRESEVATAQENGQERGYFWKTDEAGDYQIEVHAFNKDGTEIPGPPGKAKFLAYAEDLESQRPAADHEFLRKLAAAGGGTAYLGGEDKMVEFLETLLGQPLLPSRGRAEVWPDWQRTPVSDALSDQVAALWASGLLVCFLLFVALLCTEWYLRRRWGMV